MRIVQGKSVNLVVGIEIMDFCLIFAKEILNKYDDGMERKIRKSVGEEAKCSETHIYTQQPMKKIYFVILSVCFSLASCCPSFPDDKMTVLGSNYLHKILIDTNIRSFIEPNYSEMHFFDLATFIFDENVQSIEWNCEIVLVNFKKDKFKLHNADNVNSIKSPLNRCGPEVSGIQIPYSFRYNTNVQCSNSLKPYFIKKLNGSSTLFFGEDESKMQFEIGVAKGFAISYFIIEKNGKEYFLSIIYNNQLNMLHTFNKILRNSNCKIKHWQELK